MSQLRQDYKKFVKKETEILVVGPEEMQSFKAFWDDKGLPFVGLPNPDQTVLRLFGQEVNLFKLGRMPAQVVIDKKGYARFVHYGKSMSDIPSNQELLELLDELNMEA